MTAPSKASLPAGITAALVGALLGAVGWAVLTSITDYKIGYAAVGVGALTGLLAGKAGGGAAQLPPIAAAIGLIGCVVGDLLTDAHAIGKNVDVSTFTVFRKMVEHPSELGWPVYKAGFGGLDVVFYAFAALAAFRLATQHGLLQQQPAPAWAPPVGPPVQQPSPEQPAPEQA